EAVRVRQAETLCRRARRDLKQHAAELVVDLLVVLVLPLPRESLEQRADADAPQKRRIAEAERERDHEVDLGRVGLLRHPLRRERVELRLRIRAEGREGLHRAVDLAVRTEA